MLVLVKTSAACVLCMLYMAGFYYRKPHIPVKATRIFQWLIAVAIVNSFFDLITICTVNNRESVPNSVNLIAHIIYLMSILIYVYLLFLYMRSYLETDLRFSRTVKILQSVPVTASTAGIFILPITYVHGKTTDYSLGPKAYALYASLVVYLILILYYSLRYWKIMDRDKRLAIILAVPLYVVTALIQMLIPETLVVVVCSTLILLGLILSNENTEKYVDENTLLFNQYSFEKVLEEFDFAKQKLVVGVLCFCKTENNLDWRQDIAILNDIYKEIRQYHLHGYRIGENGVVFISNTQEKARIVLDGVKSSIGEHYDKETIVVETKVLAEENTGNHHACMRNIISFCTEVGSRLAYIDYLTNIYNRNALERDLLKKQEEKNVFYFLADLNDLKLVNDTIGHSAGDKLLQGFAHLLADAVGDDGRAYRQGGDEFAVLYEKDAQKFMQDLEKRCRVYNQSSAVSISYAIGYSLLENADFRDVADQMMYEDKRKKKQAR
ncbi:MAG: GGDEF domain-containing protein [Lachnospiraceae bacterium]|nr:GGDEF domain-containing protein [Lachnospiraceae bacterium]